MPPQIEYALFCLTSLFTMINPIGVIPVYIAMTEGMPPADARKVAIKATLTALIVLTLFALGGNFIFHFFSITIDSLKIVGGILFFILGFDMLQARIKGRPQLPDETTDEFTSDVAITPLAVPFICGPGAITMVILLMKGAQTYAQRIAFFISIALICIATGAILLGGRRIIGLLGDSGSKVLMRVMGLIVMVIAVEFFFAGLKPMVQNLLH